MMAIYTCKLCGQILGCTELAKPNHCIFCDFFPGCCAVLMYPERFGIKYGLCRHCAESGMRWKLDEEDEE